MIVAIDVRLHAGRTDALTFLDAVGAEVRAGKWVAAFTLFNSTVIVRVVDASRVENVSLLGIPSEILDTVITRVTVVVTAEHPIGARAIECFQNQPVNKLRLNVATDAEGDRLIAVVVSLLAHDVGFFAMPGSDFAVVSDFVESPASDNGLPVLVKH